MLNLLLCICKWIMCVFQTVLACVCGCVCICLYHTSWCTVCLMACFCSLTPALPSRRPPAQARAKAPSGRAVRSSAKPVCKTEPEMENPAGEQPVDRELQWFGVWAYNSLIKSYSRQKHRSIMLITVLHDNIYSIESRELAELVERWGGCDCGFSV